MDFINKVFRGDRVVWIIFFFLCTISIVEVYSASSTLTFHTDYWKPISKHIMFLLAGVGIVLIIHTIPPRYYSLLVIFFPFIFILLVFTRVSGTSINGSSRWTGIFGVSFQPSEIVKLSLVILTAFFLSKKESYNGRKIIFWILIFVITVTGCCFFIAIDNGSTAIMLTIIICLMLLIGQQVSFKRMFLIIAVFGMSSYAVIEYVPPNFLVRIFPRIVTWKSRFLDYKTKIDVINHRFTINDKNYQVAHASIAISNGRIFGKGPGNSIERDFLPQAYSDFIYAVIIEETGLVGGFFVLFLYIILFFRTGIIANRSKKLFPKFTAMGVALILITQTLVNMAVAVNVIPVTGQTLPLISRGGTSTLITCICFGIILSVSRYETNQGVQQEQIINQGKTAFEEN